MPCPDAPESLPRSTGIRNFTAQPSCNGCHRLLNAPGFAFIGFDTFGRFRAPETAFPGEDAGWIPKGVLEDEPRYDGLPDLMRLLARREETRRCFTRQWLEFATAHQGGGPPPPETEGSRPSVQQAYSWFEASGFRLRDLILGVVQTDAFLTR